MSERLLIQFVSEMRGTTPDVPLAPGVQMDALGENPMFVTLKIGKIGAKSDKGFTYGEQAVRGIVDQVNAYKPEGRWGHVPNEERHTKYEPPSVRWVGAILDNDGVAWGKALVLDDTTREYYRVAEATSALTGSSIYGVATLSKDRKQVLRFDVESIDIADPARLGIEDLVGIPVITAEMSESEDTVNLEEQLAAAIAERDGLQERVGEMEINHANLQADHEVVEGIRAVIGEFAESMVNIGLHINASGSDLRQVIQEMIERLQAMQATELVRAATATVGEMVAFEDLRPLVLEALHVPSLDGLSNNKAVVAEMVNRGPIDAATITEILERPHIKRMTEKLARAEAGPNVVVAEHQAVVDWREKAAAEAAEVAKSVGAI